MPLTTSAELTGEIIFVHSEALGELWITDIEDTRNARLIFSRDGQDPVIEKLSVQKGGSLLVFISYAEQLQEDVFLLDRNLAHPKEINLTKGRFDGVFDAAISTNGDVVFTTGLVEPPEARGLYLIPNRELNRRTPRVTRLKQASAFSVEWSPNGRDIAYTTDDAMFLLNRVTGENWLIGRNTRFPAFSPTGDQIAFIRIWPRLVNQIDIYRLRDQEPLKDIGVKDAPNTTGGWQGLTWSPDGQYLIYTTQKRENLLSDFFYYNTAVPITNGPHEQILGSVSEFGIRDFDWTSEPYAVEPTNLLTTLWGKLKQQD